MKAKILQKEKYFCGNLLLGKVFAEMPENNQTAEEAKKGNPLLLKLEPYSGSF